MLIFIKLTVIFDILLLVMNPSTLSLHIEALIFASSSPLSRIEILELINTNSESDNIKISEIDKSLISIEEKYQEAIFPFEIVEIGGGYQFLTKKEFHQTVMHLNADKYIKKLSTAAMETLSIIAYKQPVTKSEIEFIRGVNSDYSVQRLLEKELIIISGRNEESVGKPLLYSTSKYFMDYFGINSPHQLPELKEIVTLDTFKPNIVDENGETVLVETSEISVVNE